MMSDWTSKPFRFGPRPKARDVNFKITYGGLLKRLYASANGKNLDINLSDLRSKIANAFKFDPDAEFVLTYTDEDGDSIMLEDNSDLLDAALHQQLNPLRINVQLKIRHATEPVVPTVPINAPVRMPNMTTNANVANTPASVPNRTGAADAAASETFDILNGDTEEKLLRELYEMGFKQVDLNKEILRQNKYDLEQYVDDLGGANDLIALQDTLIAREKKDN